MKNFKSVLAMLLVLVMVFSCVGTAFAANKTEIDEIAQTKKSVKGEKPLASGFASETFAKENTYVYADDQIVRAIVLLESAPAADVATKGSADAASYIKKLTGEQKAVRNAMKGIEFELKYEFTTLLNGFSCDVAYGDLEAIAAIEGVKAVHIANTYAAPILEKDEDNKQTYANQLTGNAGLMADYGVAGQGIIVAVLDTGLNTTHEAFQDSLGLAENYGVLTEEIVAAADLSADGVYLNGKIPFAYDYADNDNDVTDHNGHGTHVSGTVGGYVGEETEDGAISFTFTGGAPAAQILSMKIFKDAGGGTSSDVYFDAIEDAYLLGADIISMSIGAQNGFTYDSELETEVFGNVYKKMEDEGVIMSVAAGNEYSMAYFSSVGYVGPEYADYGTVASPSTYEGNVSVASMENYAYPSYVIQIGEGESAKYFAFNDSAEDEKDQWLANFGGQTLDYVVITNAEGKIDNGYAESYANFDVKGKIAVVSRGDITFEEKVEFAANAGAIGCIVVNNAAGSILMSIESFEIPAVSMNLDSLETLMAADPKQMIIPEGMVDIQNANAYLMSDFSNWGTSPMLTLDPTITSVGGMVYSSVIGSDDAYEVYSGTSMATPNASATYANVLAVIYDLNPEISKADAAKLAKDLMAGTGIILKDADGYEYSPRKQGAGLACADYSVENYLNSAYIVDPLKELGDDPEKTGVYSFDVVLKNENDWECYYTDFEAIILRDYIANLGSETNPIIGNTLMSDYAKADTVYTVNGEAVTEVTVPANAEVTINVTITLTEEEKTFLDNYFTNGTYIEGFILFNEYYEGEWYSDCHATFLAFYGDWAQGPAMEELSTMDLMEANYICNTYDADGKGNTFADYGYGPYDVLVSFMGTMYTDVNTAYAYSNAAQKAMTYLGANLLDLDTTEYMPEHISFTTEASDGTYYYADSMYLIPSMLRNARHIVMTVTNAETGEVYMVDDTEYIPKGVYDEETGYWGNYSLFVWDGKDANGAYVPSGTVANVNFDIQLPWGEASDTWQKNVWNFDCTVDYTAPVLEEVVWDKEAETVTVTASDENYLAGIYLCDSSYEILDYVTFSSDKKGESFTATFDVSEIDAAYVTALDYATNEIEEWTPFYEVGLDATLTFVTPEGETKVEAKTGDVFNFEEADAPAENYEFMFWAPEQGTWSEDGVWGVSDPWWFGGDEWEITEAGDYTFYAVYAVVKEQPLDIANYYLAQAKDYTGLWSINGWDVDSSGYYVSADPNALDCNAETVKVASFDDATIGDWYVEYFTNNTSIMMDIQLGEDGLYTVKSVENGKYLATDAEMNIKFVDEVDEFAKWEVFSKGGNATYCYSAAVENAVLCYNDETHVFEILDDSEPAYGSAKQYYASEWFSTFFYKYTDVEEIVVCYSTEYPAVVECFYNNFTDCTDAWYHEAIDYCVANGLMTGVAPDRFSPNGTLNRAMVVTVLYRMEGEPAVEAPSTFTDVPEGEWFSDAVAWAQAEGIVDGVTPETFAPLNPVTREQIATILYRYNASPEAEADLSGYVDADSISVWAADAMAWAVSEGIINGVTPTELKPGNQATRAQFATIVMRILEGSYICME